MIGVFAWPVAFALIKRASRAARPRHVFVGHKCNRINKVECETAFEKLPLLRATLQVLRRTAARHCTNACVCATPINTTSPERALIKADLCTRNAPTALIGHCQARAQTASSNWSSTSEITQLV